MDLSHLHGAGAKRNEKIAQEPETADCLCGGVKVCLPDVDWRSEGRLCFSRLISSLRRTAHYNRGFGWSSAEFFGSSLYLLEPSDLVRGGEYIRSTRGLSQSDRRR